MLYFKQIHLFTNRGRAPCGDKTSRNKVNLLVSAILACFLNAAFTTATTTPCKLRATQYGHVCVCTSDYCDYLEEPAPEHDNDFSIVSTSQNGLRFATSNGTFGNEAPHTIRNTDSRTNFDSVTLSVDSHRDYYQVLGLSNNPMQFKTKTIKLEIKREEHHQKIVGFGGGFTGSVSHILKELPQALQDQVYKTYYSKLGINYNLLRTTIGGCDFDLVPWAYNEEPKSDQSLSNFTKLDARDLQKVEQWQRLKDVAKLPDLKIMAAAWSPPKWMKTNEAWSGYGQLKSAYYQTWADYHLKFLDFMADKNVSIWAISTGNEPLNGIIAWFFIKFMSLGWIPSKQARWLSENLGPTIRKSKHKNVLIFSNDDQRYTFPIWFLEMKSTNSAALDYLDGLAVHWYWDSRISPRLIDITHKTMPDKLLLNTESCLGDKPGNTHGPELGSWTRGEQYMRAYLQDLQHNFNGWIDWNLILDEQGGPSYIKNYIDAAIIVNTTNHAEFYKQPIFYAIGHFSKFITVDAVCISTEVSSSEVTAVSFQRTDGIIVVVLYNGANNAVNIVLNDSRRGELKLEIPERSWHTLLYK